VVTLHDPEVIRSLNSDFVVAWSNLVPELYGNTDPNAPPPASYDKKAVETAPEGTGGGNVRAYFCTPAGKIVHLTMGYWKPERFLAEAKLARELLSQRETAACATQAQRRAELQAEFDKAKAAVTSPSDRDAILTLARCGLRLRAADELLPDLFADIAAVLDRRREEVYTKGAVG
jgi:hypothetical protein